jgi:hypothetical protein
MSEELVQASQPAAAAALLLNYLSDVDNGVSLLTKARWDGCCGHGLSSGAALSNGTQAASRVVTMGAVASLLVDYLT